MKSLLSRRVAKTSASIAALVLILGTAQADEVLDEISSFDIPDQPLDQALLAFSRQADVQIVMAAETTRDLEAAGIRGRQSNRHALERLLADRGLKYTEHSNRTIAVHQTAASVERGSSDSGNATRTSGQVLMAQASAEQTQTGPTKSEDDEEDVLQLQKISVVGTNIRGIGDGPSPVLEFDRNHIELSGAANIEQFLRTIPQNFGGGANPGNTLRISDDGTDSDGIAFGSSVNIRGFGSGTTLTLINGRRIVSSGSASFVDVSLIPLTAIDRIEILTDGASAIYGSDAIGGVVNIILREDFTGIALNSQYGVTTEDGYDQFSVGAAIGTDWISGNAFLTYEYFGNQNLLASDRDFSADAAFQPWALIPETGRHGLFASLQQSLSPSINLFLDGTYSTRDTDWLASVQEETGFQSTLERGEIEQYGLTGGVDINLPAAWQARIEASFGNSKRVQDRIDPLTGEQLASRPGNESSTWYVRAVMDGSLFELPGGDVKVAVGTSFRSEEFEQFDSFKDDRTVFAAFSELRVPLVGADNALPLIERLELTAALRYDDFSDFGDTVNPKFGLLWDLSNEFRLRGTYGRSFRAPIFANLFDGQSTAILANLPDPASSTGRTLTILALGGNPGLGPEKAETWTAGFEYAPNWADNLTVKLNYYDIKYVDQIQRPTNNLAGVLFDVENLKPVLTFNPTPPQIDEFVNIGGLGFRIFRGGPFAVPAEFDESDTEVIADLRLGNISSTRQDGLDIEIDYSADVGVGTLSTGVSANYIFQISKRITDVSPEFDVVGTLFNPTALHLRARVGYAVGDLSAIVYVNHQDSYVDNSSGFEIDAWTTADLTLRYQPSIASGVLKNSAVTLSIQNISNNEPPFVNNLRGTGFDPTNANPLGRFVTLSVRKQF